MSEQDPGRMAAAFFRDADSMNLSKMMTWFADDIELRIANMPPIAGRQAVEATFADFWKNFTSMSHKVDEMIVQGDRLAQIAVVTYARADGRVVPLPVASHMRVNAAGKFDRLWIFIDIAPLFAP